MSNVKNVQTLTYVTVLLFVLSIIIGTCIRDFTWAIVGIFGLIIFFFPRYVTGTWTATYNWKIFAPIPILLVTFFILAITGKAGIFEELWPLSVAIQVIVTMILGYLTFLNVDMHTESVISKQWLLVFALVLTCTFYAFYFFYTITVMYQAGYPIFNKDFTELISNDESNLKSMTQMIIATFVSIAYAAIMRYLLRNTGKEELSKYNVGDTQ